MAKIKKIGHSKKSHKNKPKGISIQAFEQVHWPYLPILIIGSLLLLFGTQSGALQAAIRHPYTKVLAYSSSMSINGLLSGTNASRAANGVATLSLNGKLDNAAQAKANDMAARNYWSHYTPEGNPPWVFVSAQGYSYQKLGENLATGFNDEQGAINGWMASPPHRVNMLDPAFSEVGFGFANNPNYTAGGGGPMTIVVAFYGKPVAVAAQHPAAPPPAAPSPKARPAVAASSPAPTPVSAAASPTPAATAPADAKKQPVPKLPATTQTPKSGITLSLRTLNAQVAFANLPVFSFASGLALFGLFATVGLWVGRHLFALRRAWAHSESFVIRHPLVDAGLLIITILLFLLSRTAGFVL